MLNASQLVGLACDDVGAMFVHYLYRRNGFNPALWRACYWANLDYGNIYGSTRGRFVYRRMYRAEKFRQRKQGGIVKGEAGFRYPSCLALALASDVLQEACKKPL